MGFELLPPNRRRIPLIPLLVRRGGRGAAGVVAHIETLLVGDRPVCGAKVGTAEILLMPQPPLLTRMGIVL